MKKRIAVLTNDAFLFQKITLTLHPDAEVERLDVKDATEQLSRFDSCLWDVDSYPLPRGEEVISVGKSGALISRPFSRESLRQAVFTQGTGAPLSLGKRCAYLYGEQIRLTELEFSLLSRLLLSEGEFVSREQLIREVFGADCDGGILNVYVHYLREKLEIHGEKVIISSRKSGYKISEKYLKGEDVCYE